MRIAFVKEWRHFTPGAVADVAGGVADILLARGVAVPAAGRPPAAGPRGELPKGKPPKRPRAA